MLSYAKYLRNVIVNILFAIRLRQQARPPA